MPVELTLVWTPRWTQLALVGVIHGVLIAAAATVAGVWGHTLITCVVVSAGAEAWRLVSVVGRTHRLCFRPTFEALVLEVRGASHHRVHSLGPFHWLYPGAVVVRCHRSRWSARWLWLFAIELEPGGMAQLRRYLGGRQQRLPR